MIEYKVKVWNNGYREWYLNGKRSDTSIQKPRR